MADNIVTRLRDVVCWCHEFDGVCDACQAADEIERLRRWKAEATAVLNRWDTLCERTLEIVRIGDRKSDAMATYIESQRAEIERLRAAGERLNAALLVTSNVWGRQHQSDDDAKYHRMVDVALNGWGEARRG